MATGFSDPSNILAQLGSLSISDPDDPLQNMSSELICWNCNGVARSHKECQEFLCDDCVKAHEEGSLMKEHCISPPEEVLSASAWCSTASNNSISALVNNNATGLNCDLHAIGIIKMYCNDCGLLFCQECNPIYHRNHHLLHPHEAFDCVKTACLKILNDAKISAQTAQQHLEILQRVIDGINLVSDSVSRDLRNIMCCYQRAIALRETELLLKVENIRIEKLNVVQEQMRGFRSFFESFVNTSKALSDALELGRPLEIMQAKENISTALRTFEIVSSNTHFVDGSLSIVPPDSSLYSAIRTMGDVRTPFYLPTTIAEKLLKNTYPGPTVYQNNNSFSVGFPNMLHNDKKDHDGKVVQGSKLPLCSENHPSDILGPRNKIVNKQRSCPQIREPIVIIGSEGEEDGQLRRPWGICCTPEGNIVVADRSNNRIQIFKPDGTFLYKFGRHGSEPGFFDRPAGVAVDPQGRLVITDKDNHRIQVFTQDGQFVFTFGQKGADIGQFNYPWDVAVDALGRIAVSDTQNHRIQLFECDGFPMATYDSLTTTIMVKHIPSPRGICFDSEGHVLTTDFENHRILVVDSTFCNTRFLGTQGSGEIQFSRPQGIAVNTQGNIVVSDSRNHRIQILEGSGDFLCEFGLAGNGPGQLDQPSGICITPTGNIVVVDFGNNRIQVF